MTNMTNMTVDVLLIILLMITIWFIYSLHWNVQTIRKSYIQIKALLDQMNDAIENTRSGVFDFKVVAENNINKLSQQINDAHRIADELALISSSAEHIAQNLENKTPRSNSEKLNKDKYLLDDAAMQALREAR